VVEGETVLAQAGHAGQVSLFPAVGKMLDGALLVGQEENDVHPRDAVRGSGRMGDPGFQRGNREWRGAQEIATPQVHGHPFVEKCLRHYPPGEHGTDYQAQRRSAMSLEEQFVALGVPIW
jgi:hypothetical protein